MQAIEPQIVQQIMAALSPSDHAILTSVIAKADASENAKVNGNH